MVERTNLPRQQGRPAGFRIVLVEDNAQISALLAEVLAALGHEVCATATTELEAVAAAARHGPDLMIVDAHLQAGSGISAMDTILRLTAMPHFFMTGGARRIFPTGATVLLKPFGKVSLMAALDSVMGQSAALASGKKSAELHPVAGLMNRSE